MAARHVAQITSATIEKVGPLTVKRPLPTKAIKQVDPFIFIDHAMPGKIKPGVDIRIPPHPHAGFEVVTFLISGEAFHRDSQGNEQLAVAGDLNWMTAGSGIIHSEGPTENFLKQGGEMELMQVWINLPAKLKFTKPSFRHYSADALPLVQERGVNVKVLVGNLNGQSSPVSTHTPMFYYFIDIEKGASFNFAVQHFFTSAIYILNGSIQADGKKATAGELMNFETDGDAVSITAEENTRLIAFGGEPINEKVVSYGPFVMNSFPEIQEAIANYEQGKMGELNY